MNDGIPTRPRRALVALALLACTSAAIWGLYTYESIQAYGLVDGVVTTTVAYGLCTALTVVVCRVCEAIE